MLKPNGTLTPEQYAAAVVLDRYIMEVAHVWCDGQSSTIQDFMTQAAYQALVDSLPADGSPLSEGLPKGVDLTESFDPVGYLEFREYLVSDPMDELSTPRPVIDEDLGGDLQKQWVRDVLTAEISREFRANVRGPLGDSVLPLVVARPGKKTMTLDEARKIINELAAQVQA